MNVNGIVKIIFHGDKPMILARLYFTKILDNTVPKMNIGIKAWIAPKDSNKIRVITGGILKNQNEEKR